MLHPSSNTLVNHLLEGIREGDQACFEVFYRMERNNLVHFINSYVKDRSRSEDIAQDALLRLWERRRSLRDGGNIRALVFTTARNMAIDYLRRKTDTDSLEACLCLEDESVDGLIEALDLASLLGKTFSSLPEKLRETFIQSRAGGLTNREIALNEKVSIKAIEYRISAVLRSFKKITNSI